MPFNPVQNALQGVALAGNVQQQQQQNQINQLQQGIAQQTAQGGFNPNNSVEFQQLSALDPNASAQILSTFNSLGESRKKAMFQDTREARTLLEAGDSNGFLGVVSSRLENIERLGGDPSQTLNVLQAFNSGDMQGALDMLKRTEQVGVDLEFLSDPRVKKAAFQKGDKGLVFDPNSGTFTVDPTAKARFDELENKQADTKLDIKDKQSINKDVTGFIKQAIAIKTTAQDLKKLKKLGTGAASISAIFKFMKANDPTSTVREGEFATAETSGGVPEAIRNFYNKIVSGERIDESEVQKFIDVSEALTNSAIDSANTTVNGYLNTFEESLPKSFSSKVLKRVPSGFNVKPSTTAQSQPISVGRFQVEVQ